MNLIPRSPRQCHMNPSFTVRHRILISRAVRGAGRCPSSKIRELFSQMHLDISPLSLMQT
jgi:hypothetical protein